MNEKNLKPINSVDVAREMQQKSAEKRKQNTAERKLIKVRILERAQESDWDEMIDGLIKRAKKSNRAFEVVRDSVGEKPTWRGEVQVSDTDPALVAEIEAIVLGGEEEPKEFEWNGGLKGNDR